METSSSDSGSQHSMVTSGSESQHTNASQSEDQESDSDEPVAPKFKTPKRDRVLVVRGTNGEPWLGMFRRKVKKKKGKRDCVEVIWMEPAKVNEPVGKWVLLKETGAASMPGHFILDQSASPLMSSVF